MSLYEVIRKASGQRVAVATTDILPGTLLFTDEPLAMAYNFPSNLYDLCDPKSVEQCASLVEGILRLPVDNMQRFLNIYANELPVVRGVALHLVFQAKRVPKKHIKLLRDSISIFVANSVIIESGAQKIMGVYEKWSFVQHSCSGNCLRSFSDTEGAAVSYCKASHLIKAGEYLTIGEQSMLFTRDRREELLWNRGVTCHCPRCDAEGDDTRQFDCFDTACQGRHLVCQPLSRDSPQIADFICFEGVEYVEPHLLPCTVCGRSPPHEYQQQMLQLEESLSAKIKSMAETRRHTTEEAQLVQLYKEAAALPVPRHHPSLMYRACGLRTLICATYGQIHSNDTEWAEEFATAICLDYDAAVLTESLLRGAASEVLQMWYKCAFMGVSCLGAPEFAKKNVLKYLQTHFIVAGRDDRELDLERNYLEVLKLLPVPQEVVDMAVCAFCEESPQSAAVTLAQCARCKKVAYCSKGCQKAHWPMHKERCSNTSG